MSYTLLRHSVVCPSELSVHFWRGLFFSFSAACMQVIIFFTLKFYECVSTYSHLVALSILLNHNYISKSFQICYIKKLIKRPGKEWTSEQRKEEKGIKDFSTKKMKRWLFVGVFCNCTFNISFILLYITFYGRTHVLSYEWYFINMYKK